MVDKKILKAISSPQMIKSLTFNQLEMLSSDVRKQIIETVSENGGHLSSNLGTVELTVALLKTFDFPNDKVVWDVGHQCYAYKLLTDRKDKFSTIRQKNGISGFPKVKESPYDSFIGGHASISIAAAHGLRSASKIKGEKRFVVAVIGDGAMTGGLAYEAINNVGKGNGNLITVLNDNDMSISRSEGALAKYLSMLRTTPGYFRFKDATQNTLNKIPLIGEGLLNAATAVKQIAKITIYQSTFFEQLGFDYLGPVDGHNIKALCDVLEEAKNSRRPVMLHIKTIKGKGYPLAEQHASEYHGVSGFDPNIGIDIKPDYENFSCEFGKELLRLAENDNTICAITAAMEDSTGLTPFAKKFKRLGRFFDVGIAEAFGVTFAGGLGAGGCKPVIALYSTFLQRAYDQIIHDICIEQNKVVFAIDRAGIVGNDGETHQGIFDVAFLSTIPNMTIFSPADYNELRRNLSQALYDYNGAVVVRYPRGKEEFIPESYRTSKDNFNHFDKKSDTVIITYGRMFSEAIKASEICNCSIIKLNRVYPIDQNAVEQAKHYRNIIFVEEGILNGSISMQFATKLMLMGYKGNVRIKAIEDFVAQDSVKNCLHELGLDYEGILNTVKEEFNSEN